MFLFFVKPLTNHNFHRRKDFGRESAKTHKKPRGYRVGRGRREVGRSRMKEEHVTCMLDQTAEVGCLHAEERARWAIGAYLRENQGHKQPTDPLILNFRRWGANFFSFYWAN